MPHPPSEVIRGYFNKERQCLQYKEMDLTLRAKLSKINKQNTFQLKYVFILPAMDRTPCNTVFL